MTHILNSLSEMGRCGEIREGNGGTPFGDGIYVPLTCIKRYQVLNKPFVTGIFVPITRLCQCRVFLFRRQRFKAHPTHASSRRLEGFFSVSAEIHKILRLESDPDCCGTVARYKLYRTTCARLLRSAHQRGVHLESIFDDCCVSQRYRCKANFWQKSARSARARIVTSALKAAAVESRREQPRV